MVGGTKNSILVYTYAGELLGTSDNPGFYSGGCSDKAGDVYITDSEKRTITELAAGTVTATKTLKIPSKDFGNDEPIGCSVNPTNGDLAINVANGTSSQPAILIYPKASGRPKAYYGASLTGSPSYDPHGNLFFQADLGPACNASVAPCLEELPSGQKAFAALALQGFYLSDINNSVSWDGKYLAVENEGCNQSDYATCVYQVDVLGITARLVNTVKLSDSSCKYAFYPSADGVTRAEIRTIFLRASTHRSSAEARTALAWTSSTTQRVVSRSVG